MSDFQAVAVAAYAQSIAKACVAITPMVTPVERPHLRLVLGHN